MNPHHPTQKEATTLVQHQMPFLPQKSEMPNQQRHMRLPRRIRKRNPLRHLQIRLQKMVRTRNPKIS